ncbi:MAG TPA: polysaccharide pyruvyl transferase family protein [Pirellulales bacterium]
MKTSQRKSGRSSGASLPSAPTRTQLADFWNRLQAVGENGLNQAVPRGSKVAFLDYPVHANTGDHFIWLGTERWFERNQFDVIGRWHIDNFKFPKVGRDVVFVCQGGGNFGDLYRFQGLREAVVAKYPHNRIVFLPQTIFFHDEAAMKASAERLSRHEDLHFFVRATGSYELAKKHFAKANPRLVPDMATFLYPLSDRDPIDFEAARQTRSILRLIRCDREKSATSLVKPGETTVDWPAFSPSLHKMIWTVLVAARVGGGLAPSQWFAKQWQGVAQRLLDDAANAFREAGGLATNRLHGHILASLLGVPNIVSDNNYGKCSAYFNTWHSDLSWSVLADVKSEPGPTAKAA